MKRIILFSFLFFSVAQAQAEKSLEKLNFSGDFRLRIENVSKEGSSQTNTGTRGRARVRLLGKATLSDSLSFSLRLSTGGQSAGGITSGNQDMSDAGTRKDFSLDLAYADWLACPDLSIYFGKHPNPYWFAGKSDAMFDSDMTFEGAAAKYTLNSDATKSWANFGYTQFTNRNFTSASPKPSDAALIGAQVGTSMPIGEMSAGLGISYFMYTGMKGQATIGSGASGNSVTGTAYNYDYKILDVGAELTLQVGMPVVLFTDWMMNSDPTEKNTGWNSGFRFGKLKDVGSWTFEYTYRDITKDATVSGFAEGEFAGGGTDNRGHRMVASYQLLDNATLGLTYIASWSSVSSSNSWYQRTMADFNLVF